MPSSRSLAGAFVSPGPAMAVLRSVIQKIAAVVRVFGVSYVVVQVAIWHAFFAAHPWFLAGPLAAVAWGLAVAASLRRHRPPPPLIILDAGFYAALAISAGVCVPPDMRGVAGSWLYIAVSSQIIVTVWFAPRVLAVLLGLVLEAGYWAGTAVTPPGPAQGNAPVVSGVLLLVVLAGHWTARRMLYRRAARADLGFAAADQEARDQYVVLSRNIERREHERLLHDTVLNTLTAISRGAGGPAAVMARCRQDIALLEHVLTASGDPADPAAPAGASVADDVGAVAGEMRARGLRVHLEVAGEAGAGLPVPVAGAIVHATREALANVAAHAGTDEAWVSVTLMAGALRVTVRDAGAGFDPAGVDPARLAMGWDRRPHAAAGALDWSILGAVWLLALAALSRPAWEWVPGALLVMAVNGFFILRLLGTAAPGISRLAAAAYVMVMILGVFAALRPTLRVHAGLAARRAELASRAVTERAAVAALGEDRRDRLALLELEALPLLRGIADGSLDPGDERVRQACATHATTLRQALVNQARLGRELLAGTAARRNVAMIRAAGPAVLVLSASDKPVPVREAIRASALGYVLKNEETTEVRAAIKAVAAGKDWISPRLAYIFATDDAPDRPVLSAQETRALQLYATGMPMKSVARRMCISEETAKQYVGRVREKYARAGRAAPTKLDLYYRAVEDGHLPPHP